MCWKKLPVLAFFGKNLRFKEGFFGKGKCNGKGRTRRSEGNGPA
jgi:hypothetical protein